MAKRAPIGTAIGLVRLGVLLVCLPRVVDAQGQLVLLPQATQRLEACFASRADGWSLPDAQVTPQRVQGKACLQ